MLPVDPNLFVAFLLATALLILIPGPIVTLVVANSINRGTRFGLATTFGASLGNAVLVVAGAAGLAPILGLLTDWFDVLRWLGAAYLVYLGVMQWRAPPVALETTEAETGSVKRVFAHGFIVAITNPKTMLFFAAFFPQFIDPARAMTPQLAVMSIAFIAVAATIDSGYALLAGRLRFIFTSQARAKLRNRLVGGLLILTGIGLAAARRS